LKFGLLYEIQIPEPRDAGSERQAYAEAMEQIVYAEQLGFEHVWCVEHHLLPGWSHCSAPEVFFGALTQRTTRMRIGHAVALLPGNFNHPLRVAERVAVLDILSNGRAELGTGRAVTLQELNGFQVDPEETKAMWAEAIQIVPRAWRDEPVEWQGKYWQIPPSNVVPKPVQKPHPPLWLAGTNPETFETAGKNGVGLLGFVTGKPEDVAGRLGAYKNAVKDPERVPGDFINDQAAILIQTHCAESREQAFEETRRPLDVVAELGAQLVLPWAAAVESHNYPSYQYLVDQMKAAADSRAGQNAANLTVEARAADRLIAVGDPNDIYEHFKLYEEMGADQLMLWVQYGGLAHDRIMNSLRLLGEHVLPKFGAVPLAAAV
jgi:alkanesulfonate monooxygenase SsuD/methylene tetrahydromethanopterin reductase-like flavin-dependent oxidoreductase (luciferase family)